MPYQCRDICSFNEKTHAVRIKVYALQMRKPFVLPINSNEEPCNRGGPKIFAGRWGRATGCAWGGVGATCSADGGVKSTCSANNTPYTQPIKSHMSSHMLCPLRAMCSVNTEASALPIMSHIICQLRTISAANKEKMKKLTPCGHMPYGLPVTRHMLSQ